MQVGDKVELVSTTTFRGKTLEAGLAGVLVEPSPGGAQRVAVDFGTADGAGPVVQWPVEAAPGALRRVDGAGATPESVAHPAAASSGAVTPGASPLGDWDLDLELP